MEMDSRGKPDSEYWTKETLPCPSALLWGNVKKSRACFCSKLLKEVQRPLLPLIRDHATHRSCTPRLALKKYIGEKEFPQQRKFSKITKKKKDLEISKVDVFSTSS